MAKGKTDSLRRKDGAWAPLESNRADKSRAERVPETPQTLSPAYRLAFADLEFLSSEELRPLRLQLELMKVEMALVERDISRGELYRADEIVMTATAAEQPPLRELDDHPIGDGTPGPITREIQSVFEDALHGRSERYAHWLDVVRTPAPAS